MVANARDVIPLMQLNRVQKTFLELNLHLIPALNHAPGLKERNYSSK